jgi:hypothetical protein
MVSKKYSYDLGFSIEVVSLDNNGKKIIGRVLKGERVKLHAGLYQCLQFVASNGSKMAAKQLAEWKLQMQGRGKGERSILDRF